MTDTRDQFNLVIDLMKKMGAHNFFDISLSLFLQYVIDDEIPIDKFLESMAKSYLEVQEKLKNKDNFQKIATL